MPLKSCRHTGRRLCVACVMQTAIFPVEHLVWSKLLGPLLRVSL